MKLQIINGPNLNLLDKREKNIYGDQSFDCLGYTSPSQRDRQKSGMLSFVGKKKKHKNHSQVMKLK